MRKENAVTETVSIIVPVYNAAAYIGDTIRQVLAQTLKDWELILVDDRSTDGSAAIIEKAIRDNPDRRIVYLLREENGGPAKARNDGIMAAAGRYIAFLDADDVWFPEKLERELDFMRRKDAAFVYTSYEFGDSEARGTGKIVRALPELTYRRALTRTIIFTSTVMFDLAKLDRSLILMPDIRSEDTATWWAVLRTGEKAYGLDEVLTVYRRPPKSMSSNKGRAVARIWRLYRREGLGVLHSAALFVQWAVRATLRRL